MTIRRFEDLDAWKEARRLVNLVFDTTDNEDFRRARGLRDQMERAAVSVLSNIAEGFASGSNAEFSRFLRYARRSTAELQCQIYIAADRRVADRKHCRETYAQAEKTAKIINGLKRYLTSQGKTAPGEVANQRGNEPTR